MVGWKVPIAWGLLGHQSALGVGEWWKTLLGGFSSSVSSK